ncbi:MAG: YceI family protein [Caulobacterales bacterium]
MSRRLAALALALASTAAPAIAAPPAWAVDKAASHLTFSSSVQGAPFSGQFRLWDAAIRFDPKDLAHSSVVATIDMASAVSGDKDRDISMPTEDWFWTSRFPRATFAAAAFRATGPGRYEAVGTLSMRGVSKPLTLPFSLAITGASAKMSARVGINRLAFGVGQGEWQTTETVPAAVVVSVDLTAHRAP